MSIHTEETLQTLTGFSAPGAPVTTCYLDVDGRRFLSQRDVEAELERVMRPIRKRNSHGPSVEADFAKIERYVREGFDRSNVKGLAFFACSAAELFSIVPLPIKVRSRIIVNDQPAVAQLEAIRASSSRFGMLLVDRQTVRMFVFELDELVEHHIREGESTRSYDIRGERERGDTSAHIEALTSQHVKSAAELAFDVFQSESFEFLCMGGPDEALTQLQLHLHPYLVRRLVGRVPVTPRSNIAEIRAAAAAAEAKAERARESLTVRQLLDSVKTNGRAVMGLADTLAALNQRRVEKLIVSSGFEVEGWRCESTGDLFCVRPLNSPTLHPVDDVVEEAIDDAISQGARVELCLAQPDLDVHGRVGALLRY